MSISSTHARLADRLVDHYADLLGLDWRRRMRLMKSPTSDISALAALDDRLDAAIDALRELGTAAKQHMHQSMAEPLDPGRMYATVSYALACGDSALRDACRAIAQSMPHLRDGFVAALESSDDIIDGAHGRRFVESLPLAMRFRFIASRHREAPYLAEPAFGELRRLDPDSRSTDEPLAEALRCLQFLGGRPRASAAVHQVTHTAAHVRLSAARTLLELASIDHATAAVDALLALAHEDSSSLQEDAVQCLALHAANVLPAGLTKVWNSGSVPRLRLQSLGWSGSVDVVPELIDLLDDPALGRVAGAALSFLTGLDPVKHAWQSQSPAAVSSPRRVDDAGSPSIPASDPDVQLPWPSRSAFTRLWSGLRSNFDRSSVWMAGRPVTVKSMQTVLASGPLAWRPMAAARLQRLNGDGLFPTHLPAQAQMAHLTTLSGVHT